MGWRKEPKIFSNGYFAEGDRKTISILVLRGRGKATEC